MHAAPVCPDCSGFLQQRGGEHPMDRLVRWFPLTIVWMQIPRLWPAVHDGFVVVSGIALAGLAVAMVYLFIKYKRSPIYYERHVRASRPF